jgi:dTDP-4-dehydrorhamnose 3,5-epimerase
MGAIALDHITITPLARIATPNGDVMHGMKQTEASFNGFGEAYFSWIEGTAVKAWKRHTRMTMNMIVPVGEVRFVFFDEATDKFREERIGTNNYCRITVPPGIWFGFQGCGQQHNLLLNIASILHDPLEVERRSIDEIKFNW